jgi:hypothetical protein
MGSGSDGKIYELWMKSMESEKEAKVTECQPERHKEQL